SIYTRLPAPRTSSLPFSLLPLVGGPQASRSPFIFSTIDSQFFPIRLLYSSHAGHSPLRALASTSSSPFSTPSPLPLDIPASESCSLWGRPPSFSAPFHSRRFLF